MAETHPAGTAESGERRAVRSRPIRGHLRDGLEAALRTDPMVVATCKTRTGLGLLVRELMLEAARGKTPAIKVMLSLLDWTDTAQRAEDAPPIPSEGDSQGSKKTSAPAEPHWDWNAAGGWDSQPEEEPTYEPETSEPGTSESEISERAEAAAPEGDYYLRRLRAKFQRMHEAQQAEKEEMEAKARTEAAAKDAPQT